MKLDRGKRSVNIGWNDWVSFLQNNYFMIGCTLFFESLLFGRRVISLDFGIDMEVIMGTPKTTYNWLDIGRPGLVLVKRIFSTDWYNPYLEGMLFIITLFIACMVMDYLLFSLSVVNSKKYYVLFNVLFMTTPALNEQFYFAYQSFEVVLGMLLTALAALLILKWILNNKIWDCVLAIAFMSLAFSIYQSFVSMYIAMCISVYLAYYKNLSDKKRNVDYLKIILRLIVSFLIAFLAFEIPVKLFYSGSSYLSGQVTWGKIPLKSSLINSIWQFKRMVDGQDLLYNLLYPLAGAALGIYFVIYTLRCVNFLEEGNILYVLSGFAFLASPLLLSIVMGNIITYRSQLTLPYVVAYTVVYLLDLFSSDSMENKMLWKRAGKVILLAVAVYFAYDQTALMARIFYTSDVCQANDERVAAQIAYDISRVSDGADDYPIVFVGSREADLNASCIRYSYLGESAFEFSNSMEPYYYWSTRRILGFFNVLGINYKYPSRDQVSSAREEAQYMAVWPQEGSVVKSEDKIIVKLGEDEFWE